MSPLPPFDDRRAPGYWQHEMSGVLRPAIEAYLNRRPMTQGQKKLMRLYLEQWIDSPVWDMNPHHSEEARADLAKLRQAAHRITTRKGIDDWLRSALDLGIDPL